MKKKALVVIFEGFEELEAVGPVDLLRRAGVDVMVAAINHGSSVHGRNNITMEADMMLEDVVNQDYDLIVLPGGPGHIHMRGEAQLKERLKKQIAGGGLVGAICAAPLVLLDAGLLEGRRYTAHHSTQKELPGIITNQAVVEDGQIITSRGAGTALEFGLALVARLLGAGKAKEVADSVCYRPA